jgi:Ca2+-binding RTX toxin-like protein
MASWKSVLPNLTLTGTSSINGTGNALVNVLIGNSGDNVLSGGGGGDTLIGGAGDDTYVIRHVADVATEGVDAGVDRITSAIDYTLGANFENLVLTGTVALDGTGNSAANSIYGNSAANVLSGGDGDDFLSGESGADTLIGGNGNDWAHYRYATAGVSASLTAAITNTGDAAGDTYTQIENLTASDFDDKLQGNDSKNYINGNEGNDLFIATLGGDRLDGGDGIDTISYINAAKGVYINLNALQS